MLCVAEVIHQRSKRKDYSYIKVNLGGVSDSLFESEMFGHTKGAFTDASTNWIGSFQKADQGTIFLDEIGELPLASQVKHLRVLQEKQFELLGSSQSISCDGATNKNLEEMVLNVAFREDLFYRINFITLHIPSLADRRDDIPSC